MRRATKASQRENNWLAGKSANIVRVGGWLAAACFHAPLANRFAFLWLFDPAGKKRSINTQTCLSLFCCFTGCSRDKMTAFRCECATQAETRARSMYGVPTRHQCLSLFSWWFAAPAVEKNRNAICETTCPQSFFA